MTESFIRTRTEICFKNTDHELYILNIQTSSDASHLPAGDVEEVGGGGESVEALHPNDVLRWALPKGRPWFWGFGTSD